eukprot:8703516-Heterocapsa_arctica.AAC.1
MHLRNYDDIDDNAPGAEITDDDILYSYLQNGNSQQTHSPPYSTKTKQTNLAQRKFVPALYGGMRMT